MCHAHRISSENGTGARDTCEHTDVRVKYADSYVFEIHTTHVCTYLVYTYM